MWWLILKMAWRNLWRNTRRTIITAGAIGLGLALMIFSWMWMLGMDDHLVQTVTLSGYGDAQVHAEGFRRTRDAELVIPAGQKVLAKAETTSGIISAAPRAYAVGLAAIGDRSASVEVIGVDPAREQRVTNWQTRLAAGRYPAKPNEALIGVDLADDLEVEAGSKLVITVADIHTGDMAARLLKIVGLVATSNPAIDKHSVVIPLASLQKSMGLGDEFHELALRVTGPVTDQAHIEAVIAPLKAPGLEVAPWQVLASVVASMMDLQGVYMALSLVIIFTIVAFGIVNTMSMSLLERFREFGIMRAVGASPVRLAGLILAEAASLGVVGCAMGLAVGYAVHLVISRTGIPLGQMEALGVTFKTPIYTVFDPVGIGLMTLTFLILTPLVALFPAVRAARVDVIRALRRD